MSYMTLEQAQEQALQRARVMDERWYVLGPCPVDGYWTTGEKMRVSLWPDREIVFTAEVAVELAIFTPGRGWTRRTLKNRAAADRFCATLDDDVEVREAV